MFIWRPVEEHHFELAYSCQADGGQKVHFQLVGPDNENNKYVVDRGPAGSTSIKMATGVIVTEHVPTGGKLKFATTLRNTVNVDFSN